MIFFEGPRFTIDIKINVMWSVKRKLNAFAKNIDPCQDSAQANMGRKLSLSLNSACQTMVQLCLNLLQINCNKLTCFLYSTKRFVN